MGERILIRTHAAVFTAVWLVAGLGLHSTARADVFSFTYSELEGDFAVTGADSGLFTAADQVGILPFHTQGDVTRLAPPTDTAIFDFADAAIGSASIDLSVAASAITDNHAVASGTLTLVDIDGDTISGSISGQWIRTGSSAALIALWSDVVLDNKSMDTTFDGTDGSSWSMTFSLPGRFSGNVVALAFDDWFTDGAGTVVGFENTTTLASGAVLHVVPEPGTLSLLAIGGFAALRTIRRKRHWFDRH